MQKTNNSFSRRFILVTAAIAALGTVVAMPVEQVLAASVDTDTQKSKATAGTAPGSKSLLHTQATPRKPGNPFEATGTKRPVNGSVKRRASCGNGPCNTDPHPKRDARLGTTGAMPGNKQMLNPQPLPPKSGVSIKGSALKKQTLPAVQ